MNDGSLDSAEAAANVCDHHVANRKLSAGMRGIEFIGRGHRQIEFIAIKKVAGLFILPPRIVANYVWTSSV